MDSKVKVTANDKGDVIVVSEGNPAYGYIRVEQQRELFDEQGWLRVKTLSALIPGLVSDLKQLRWYDGQFIPGKVYIKEQLTPFNQKDPEKSLKIAGETKVVCKDGDKPIHRNTFYHSNPNTLDVTWPHTNGDEIKAAYVGTEGMKGQPVESFAGTPEAEAKKDFHL